MSLKRTVMLAAAIGGAAVAAVLVFELTRPKALPEASGPALGAGLDAIEADAAVVAAIAPDAEPPAMFDAAVATVAVDAGPRRVQAPPPAKSAGEVAHVAKWRAVSDVIAPWFVEPAVRAQAIRVLDDMCSQIAVINEDAAGQLGEDIAERGKVDPDQDRPLFVGGLHASDQVVEEAYAKLHTMSGERFTMKSLTELRRSEAWKAACPAFASAAR